MVDDNHVQFTKPLTRTEQRLYDMLKDGEPHRYSELMTCMEDDMAGYTALAFHISNMRSKMPSGYLIVAVLAKRSHCYRLTRHLYQT